MKHSCMMYVAVTVRDKDKIMRGSFMVPQVENSFTQTIPLTVWVSFILESLILMTARAQNHIYINCISC
jgi:hypothetical protein